MCTCGCGDFEPILKLPGPKGFWYTLEIKKPCRYCETPLGIRLSRLTTEEMKNTGAMECGQVTFHACGPDESFQGWRDAYISILDPQKMADSIRGFIEGDYCDTQDAAIMIEDAMTETKKMKEGATHGR